MTFVRRFRVLLAVVALALLMGTGCGGSETAADGNDAIVNYCVALARIEALLDELDFTNPDAVQDWAGETMSLLDHAIESGPAEVVDDLLIQKADFEDTVALLEANEWDFLAILDQPVELSFRPAIAASQERLDAWESENCADVGVPEEADGAHREQRFEEALEDPEVFAEVIETEWGRAALVAQISADGKISEEQAWCLVDEMDMVAFFDWSEDEGPPADVLIDMIEAFDVCGVPFPN